MEVEGGEVGRGGGHCYTNQTKEGTGGERNKVILTRQRKEQEGRGTKFKNPDKGRNGRGGGQSYTNQTKEGMGGERDKVLLTRQRKEREGRGTKLY